MYRPSYLLDPSVRPSRIRPEQALFLIPLAFFLIGCGRQGKPPETNARLVEAMNRGVSLMGQYQYDPAAKAFEEALAIDPGLADARVNLAIALFNRGRREDRDMDRSSRLLNDVLTRDPENLRALYFRGIMLQHAGQAEAAIPCFDKVTRARPDDGVAWYLLGLCKIRLDQAGEEELLKSVSLRPYLYSAYYQLYQAALRRDEAEKARAYLERFQALRENPLGEVVELPQYMQMGELALARPMAAQERPPSTGRWMAGPVGVILEFPGPLLPPADEPHRTDTDAPAVPPLFGGIAAGDVNQDGRPDLILTASTADVPGQVVLLTGDGRGKFANTTAGSGLEGVRHAVALALGDYDNDGKADLFVARAGENRLFRGDGQGAFTDVTQSAGTGGDAGTSRSALFIDADHDGDLDILVCQARGPGDPDGPGCRLLNNNADGTFTDITEQAGLACPGSRCVLALPGDVDGDRDADLVVLRAGAPARLFLNDLSGRYHEASDLPEIRGDAGGVLQDFNGDGQPDLLVLGAQLRLFLGDGRGHLRAHEPFDEYARAAASWGPVRGLRVADVDLDGDLDIGIFAQGGHLLLNAGAGRFVLQTEAFPGARVPWTGAELLDLTGDLLPDVVLAEAGPAARLMFVPGALTPPSTGLAIVPTGVRERDRRTRSPACGFGVRIRLRTGLYEQSLMAYGQAGGPNQSWLPVLLGLGGAPRADYVSLHWPDGVAQVEVGLAAGQSHRISEMQRKISSCPVLFGWSGDRFDFITDFAGVGGLGYYAGPGESAPPRALEHVKIEPEQLKPRQGFYELRVTEPMEESAYVDRLELLAIDHAWPQRVFPDERLTVSGPPPSQKLLAIGPPIFPRRARGPRDQECTRGLIEADRRYAYAPPLDRRFYGYCEPHRLVLEFGDSLASLATDEPVFLFIRGSMEYPYSQTVYAAAQAGVHGEPIRVERLTRTGEWDTVVPDAGAPGGTDRTIAVDLTGKSDGENLTLRLTTNLELYYDQVFLAREIARPEVCVRSIPLASAELRRVGFAREVSPDGQLPLIYDYHISEATASFHVLRGAYTRYGPVQELLAEFDDRYVLVGPGDEIALRFDATRLPAVSEGRVRSFVLVSHTYCKDMDLYTATPQTLWPLPFRGMSRYPYSAPERFPETEKHRAVRAAYNTRIIE
jgi:Flp pilus assembly protein TadD